MFWIGQTVTLIAGLIGIGLFRRMLRTRWPLVKDLHLDIIFVFFLFVIIVVNSVDHFQQDRVQRTLETQVAALRDFGEVAKLNVIGVTGTVEPPLQESSRISRALDGAWRNENGHMIPNCDDQSIAKYRQVTSLEPRFPFSRYALALCLLDRGDNEWQSQAVTALGILEITTTIAGRHVNHDQAYRHLKQLLADRTTH